MGVQVICPITKSCAPMKKILSLSVLLSLIIFCYRQTSLMISRGGNLSIYACNSSDLENVTIEVFINGESVFIEDHSNEKNPDYKGFSLYESTGRYEVKVVAAKQGIAKTTMVDLISVKWINIEFVNDENDSNKYDLQLSVESSPMVEAAIKAIAMSDHSVQI